MAVTKTRYTKEEAAAMVTVNDEPIVTEEPEAPQPSVMLDDRDDVKRLKDIRQANEDRLSVFARQIDAGKAIELHPIVITDLDFVLKYLSRLESRLALFEGKAS